MKIGIFGGSFNPPHKMHETIPVELIQNKYVDKVIYVPTGDKYNKSELVDFKHRYNMVKLLNKNNDDIEVSDYEYKSDLTYTYQTLNYFKELYPNDEIYFILGTDLMKDVDTWRNSEYILENYKFLVNGRDNYGKERILEKYNKYMNNIVFSNLKEEVLSSTMIRDNFDEYKEKINEDVLDYIKKEKLYI